MDDAILMAEVMVAENMYFYCTVFVFVFVCDGSGDGCGGGSAGGAGGQAEAAGGPRHPLHHGQAGAQVHAKLFSVKDSF